MQVWARSMKSKEWLPGGKIRKHHNYWRGKSRYNFENCSAKCWWEKTGLTHQNQNNKMPSFSSPLVLNQSLGPSSADVFTNMPQYFSFLRFFLMLFFSTDSHYSLTCMCLILADHIFAKAGDNAGWRAQIKSGCNLFTRGNTISVQVPWHAGPDSLAHNCHWNKYKGHN